MTLARLPLSTDRVLPTRACCFAALLLPLALPPQVASASPPNVEDKRGAAIAPSHGSIRTIAQIREAAFDLAVKEQFQDANEKLEEAFKAAQRLSSTHWSVRRLKETQRYVARLAALSTTDRETALWTETYLRKAHEAYEGGHVTFMREFIKLAETNARSADGAEGCEHLRLLRLSATACRASGKLEDEERMLKARQLLVRRLFGDDDPEHAYVCSELAMNQGERGNFKDAEKLLAEARRVLGSDTDGKEKYRVVVLSNEGEYWMNEWKLGKAETAFREALAQAVDLSDDPTSVVSLTMRVALVHALQRRTDLAKRELSEAREKNEKLPGQSRRHSAGFLASVGEVEYELQQYADAERHLTSAVGNFEAMGFVMVNGAFQLAEGRRAGRALYLLGQVYEDTEQYRKAEDALSKALPLCRQVYGDSSERTHAVVDMLVRVLKKQGRAGEADRLRSSVPEIKKNEQRTLPRSAPGLK